MEQPAIQLTACQFRSVRWSLPVVPCDRCEQPARRIGEATRTAIDIALDQPAVLAVAVSVHHCPPCRHAFRAQPPFLRPDATYSRRVVATAVASVYQDGMAFRRVAARLARDFWVRPSEAMIRGWCRAYGQTVAFADDYQPWVVGEFSGVLCVDEVYQDRLALLLAVDPAAADGDRLVGYQLVHGAVGQAEVRDFLQRLRQVGIDPAQVITDGSPLYPAVVATVWPRAAHQLCLFHQTRRVTRAVQQVITTVRAALPPLPPGFRPAIAEGAAAEPGGAAPPAPAVGRRGRGRCRREVRRAGIALVHALHRQGGSVQAIARQTGISRPTVRSWLQQPDPTEDVGGTPGPLSSSARLEPVAPPAPPPAPWESWEQVHRVRQGLGVGRFRLLCRPEHLTPDDRAAFTVLFASPVGGTLRLARSFLEDWYAIWRDEAGARQPPAEALERYERWRSHAEYGRFPPLRRIQEQIDAERFERLSQFLRVPTWEATNNGAERRGRAFRHRQGPHFNLRSAGAIGAALEAEACLRAPAGAAPPEHAPTRCARGRKGRPRSLDAAA